MEEFLGLLRQGCRTDHAEGHPELIESPSRLHAESDRSIQPAGIGTIPQGRIPHIDIARREHALAEGITMADLASFGEPRNEARQHHGPPGCGCIPTGHPDQHQPIGIVPVHAMKRVVFQDETQRTGLR